MMSTPRGNFLRMFLLLCAVVWSFPSWAQTSEAPISDPKNRAILNSLEDRVKELLGKNMNRFAYEKLQTYNYWLDTLYKKEKTDTLAKIDQAYKSKSAIRISTIAGYRKQITELSTQKEKLEKRYWSLARKALLSFTIWLVIILLLMFFRKRKFKSKKTELESATIQLSTLESLAQRSDRLFNDFAKIKEPFEQLNEETAKIYGIVAEAAGPDSKSEVLGSAQKLKQQVDLETKVVTGILSQSNDPADEKVSSEINVLCEQFLEIVSRGFMKSEDFNFQVTRDFEKRLPAIKINPSAAGTLLLNVISNAFHSVKEKSKQGIKGYQPKISVSTRILPRFLQVRVKDNGIGMSEEIIKLSTTEFYSTRPLEEGTGLGLYFANIIINEMHKGEIKIESENGASTDVYIKFFI